jgi:hypothetical protein
LPDKPNMNDLEALVGNPIEPLHIDPPPPFWNGPQLIPDPHPVDPVEGPPEFIDPPDPVEAPEVEPGGEGAVVDAGDGDERGDEG